MDELNHDDRMGSRTVLIHQCWGQRSIFWALIHSLLDIHITKDLVFSQSLYINTQSLILTNFQAVWWSFIGRNKQILNFFVVDLQHRQSNLKLLLPFSLIFLDPLKDFLANHRDNATIDAISNHGIRLACSSLAVCKQAAIVALPVYMMTYHALSKISLPMRL